jgi:uncharacterized membrane protein YhaH (DUF805 family)
MPQALLAPMLLHPASRRILRAIRLLRFLFGLTTPVARGPYALTGFGLMTLKYAVEAAAIHAVTGRVFMPWQFVSPLMSTRTELLRGAPWLLWVLVAWALPFLWIGVAMTLRRTVDAGLSPLVAFLYFVPVLNLALMIALCFLPSRPPRAVGQEPEARARGVRFREAVLGTLLGLSVTLLMAVVSIRVLREYTATLFFATPLIVGACCGIVLNYRRPQPLGPTIGVALLAMVITGGALLLFALEGIICLAMAAPIALPLAVAGALLGRAMALWRWQRPAQVPLMIAVLPLLLLAEAGARAPLSTSVTTAIEIDAPPERVWPHVVGFGQITEPLTWIFRAGIACPMRARMDGAGAGAVRHCEFTTGPFVEPITVWDEPRRLAFDVVAEPAPMVEWSPYGAIDAPHLHGYLHSQRGEFRLLPLPGGRTRLEGTTWYALRLYPSAYWHLWSDLLIHRIHERVLVHIKREVESR